MMPVSPPSASAAAPAFEANLASRAKLFVGVCALVTTLATAGINGCVNYRAAIAQADDAMRKSDVRKLEDQLQQFTGLTRVFVAGINHKEPSEAAREAVSVNIQQQYEFLGTLEPLLESPKDRTLLNDYRSSLVEMNKTLRKSDDIKSTMAFARAASVSVDARIALVNALRGAAGMPVAQPAENATMPVEGFGSS